MEPMIVAHRGYSSRAPENTLASLRLALESGAHAVEFDVQESMEGTPVVFHDYELGRTATGEGMVADLSIDELLQADAGSWFGPGFAGERIPTLDQALGLLAKSDVEIFLEIKSGLSEAAIIQTVRLLKRHQVADRTTIISFDWWCLHLVRDLSGQQRVGFLVGREPEVLQAAIRRASSDGNAIVDAWHGLLLDRPDLVEPARKAGVGVACFTVDDIAVARRLAESGVSALTTNDPGSLIQGFAPDAARKSSQPAR